MPSVSQLGAAGPLVGEVGLTEKFYAVAAAAMRAIDGGARRAGPQQCLAVTGSVSSRALFAAALYVVAVEGADWDQEASALKAAGQYEEALRGYTELCDSLDPLDPNRSVAQNQRGVCLSKLKRPAEAVDAYTEAIENENHKLFKDRYIWHMNRGLVLERMLNSGLVLKRQGEFDRAREDFEKVIELRPHSSQATTARYRIASREARALKAVRFYEAALLEFTEARDSFDVQDHNWIVCQHQRADCLVQLGQADEAVSAYDEAFAAIVPGQPARGDEHKLYLGLGTAYQLQGEWTQAMRIYEHVVQLRPDSPEAKIALDLTVEATADQEAQLYLECLAQISEMVGQVDTLVDSDLIVLQDLLVQEGWVPTRSRDTACPLAGCMMTPSDLQLREVTDFTPRRDYESWDTLTNKQINAARKLGWNAKSWGMETDTSVLLWEDLNRTGRQAVGVLGFDEMAWDTYIPDLGDTREGFIDYCQDSGLAELVPPGENELKQFPARQSTRTIELGGAWLRILTLTC